MMIKFLQDIHRLHTALITRGFSVRQLHDRLLCEAGAARYEWDELKELLDAAGVQYRADSRSIMIYYIRDIEKAIGGIQFHESYGGPNPQWYDFNWKSFTRRKFCRRVSAMNYDPGVAYFVKSIGKAGIQTTFSSDGRGQRKPFIEFAGLWNGIWFQYLFANHLPLEGLHYRWMVTQHRNGSVRLTAARPLGVQWELALIQQDMVRMGAWFERFAATIRSMRQKCFKYRSMKQEAEAVADNYTALKQWMYLKINEATADLDASRAANMYNLQANVYPINAAL